MSQIKRAKYMYVCWYGLDMMFESQKTNNKICKVTP